MQIVGDELIPYEPLVYITNEGEICKNCLYKYDRNLIKISKQKGYEFSLICSDISQAIIANAVGARYIVCEIKDALVFSELANFYMFDAKIACVISDESELSKLAKTKIDTAIYKRGIKNGTF